MNYLKLIELEREADAKLPKMTTTPKPGDTVMLCGYGGKRCPAKLLYWREDLITGIRRAWVARAHQYVTLDVKPPHYLWGAD